MKDVDLGAIQRLLLAATEERLKTLREAHRQGPERFRFELAADVCRCLAAIDLRATDFRMADVERSARERYVNDPVFHATVRQLVATFEEYLAVALEAPECPECKGHRVRVYPGTPLGHTETCRLCKGSGLWRR